MSQNNLSSVQQGNLGRMWQSHRTSARRSARARAVSMRHTCQVSLENTESSAEAVSAMTSP